MLRRPAVDPGEEVVLKKVPSANCWGSAQPVLGLAVHPGEGQEPGGAVVERDRNLGNPKPRMGRSSPRPSAG
jgi:hypothetical protein